MPPKGEIGAEKCYLTLLAFYITASSEERFFKSNRELKRWLTGLMLLRNDDEIVGPKDAKRIFWLLSVANSFIKRENKRIVITEEGRIFLWADQFKRFEIFKDRKIFPDFSSKKIGHRGSDDQSVASEVAQNDNLVKDEPVHKKISDVVPKKSQGGLIFALLGADHHESDIHRSSVIYMEVNVCSDCHRDSKTPEIYMFDSSSGKGFIRVGEEKIAVGPGSFIYVPAGAAHYLAPSAGEILKTWVVSPTAWEREEDFVRGKEVSDVSSPGM